MKDHGIAALMLVGTALAACGGGGDGGGDGGSFSLDSPTFLTVGVPLSALSSNTASGTAGNQATVTLNGDGSVTLGLPGSDQLTLSSDDIFEIITTPSGTLERYTYQTAAGDRATVDIGRDLAGTDLYLLSLVDRAGSTLGYETAMVVGDETTSMPATGSGNIGASCGAAFSWAEACRTMTASRGPISNSGTSGDSPTSRRISPAISSM